MSKRRMRILRMAGIVVAACFIGLFLTILYFASTLPSFAEIGSRAVAQSTKIYDRTGTILLHETSASGRRTVVSFDEIPQSLKDATIAIEDEHFYTEPAFDWRGIARALYVNITSRSISQGGSTITQQVARTAFLTLNQTLSRKLKELILAIRLGEYYSKDEILALYLNEVPYGPNLLGVEAASKGYFGVSVGSINLAQSALLAALPQAPSYYSPWGSHTSELLKRQRLVLQRMYATGKISKKQLDEALAYKITFQPRSDNSMKAPHFVLSVLDDLIQKYGEGAVNQGGLKVITTLDWNLQQQAEIAAREGAERNQRLYEGYNAALVAQDPKTGQILALVGSKDYFATSSLPAGCTPGVNCKFEPNFNVPTQGLRQPGSALKPFVYLTAFQEGYTPDTVLFDVPTEFSANAACPAIPDFNAPTDKRCFHPQDFEPYQGPISLRNGLAGSVNVVAVKALYLAGLKNSVANAYDFGLTTLTDPDSYGLSLVLGGGAVHLIDLTGAYSVLAQDGIKHQQATILEVKDASGKTLESYSDQSTRVADEQSVRLVNNILSDPAARSGLFQSSLNLTVFPGHDVALKTGTSNDYRDTWAMGYTPSLVVGVWAGNNDNKPMVRQGSSLLAAIPMWSAFLRQVLPTQPLETFTRPEPTNPAKPVLAGNYAPEGQLHSILYYVDKNDPKGPAPSNPYADPQFRNWETAILSWASGHLIGGGTPASFVAPAAAQAAAASAADAPRVSINTPAPGTFVNDAVNISAKITGNNAITNIGVYWNGANVQNFSGSFGANYDFSYSFTPQSLNGQNLLEITASYESGNAGKASLIVYH